MRLKSNINISLIKLKRRYKDLYNFYLFLLIYIDSSKKIKIIKENYINKKIININREEVFRKAIDTFIATIESFNLLISLFNYLINFF